MATTRMTIEVTTPATLSSDEREDMAERMLVLAERLAREVSELNAEEEIGVSVTLEPSEAA